MNFEGGHLNWKVNNVSVYILRHALFYFTLMKN